MCMRLSADEDGNRRALPLAGQFKISAFAYQLADWF